MRLLRFESSVKPQIPSTYLTHPPKKKASAAFEIRDSQIEACSELCQESHPSSTNAGPVAVACLSQPVSNRSQLASFLRSQADTNWQIFLPFFLAMFLTTVAENNIVARFWMDSVLVAPQKLNIRCRGRRSLKRHHQHSLHRRTRCGLVD